MKKVIALVLTLIMMFTVIAPAVSVGAIATDNSNNIVSTIDETTDNNNEEKVSFFDKISQFFHNILAKIASVFNAKCPMCGKNHDDLDVDIDYDGTDNHIHVTVQKEVSRIEPTCGDRGSYVVASTCTICNTIVKTEVMPIPATGDHQYVVVEAVAPACTRTGWTEGENCSVCGDVRVERKSVPALGHAWKAATCTAPKTCDRCDATEGKALGHGYTTKVTAPTCTNAGYTTYTCDACGDTYVADEVKALGHNYNVVVTAPTCTDSGYTTYTCATCGYTYVADEVEALGHSYDAVVTAPTCTDGGYTTYTCICKDTYTDDETDALGHSFTNYVSDGNATCLEDGTKTAKCDRCDVTDTIADEGSALKHSFTNYVSNKDATCTVDGTKTAKCDRCVVTDTIADEGSALKHSFKNYESNKDATCLEDGTKTAKCDRCDVTDTVTDEGSALDHSFTNYVSDGNATCLEDGTKTAKCDRCVVTDTIADVDSALDHSFTNYESNNDAECEQNGTKTATCDRCDATDTVTDEGSALEHVYDIIDKVDATCTEGGYTTYWCDLCETGYTRTYDALSHIDKDENYYCDREGCNALVCDHKDCEYKINDAKNATCTTDGFTGNKCCSRCNTIIEEGSVIEAIKHAWTVTYDFAADGKTCTATRVCANDANHNVTVEATITSTVKTPATCEGMGTTTYTATFDVEWAEAQTKNVVDIAALGHTWSDATCEAPKTCSVCNATEGAKLGHSYETVVTVPTCVDKGYTTYTCATCGDNYVADEVSALGHNYEAVVTAPTCVDKGYTTYTCATCGDNYVADEVSVIGHNYETVVTASTCEDKGYTTYTCTCGDTYTDNETAALGHSFTKYISNNNATCTVDGTKTAKCDRCDETNTMTDEGSATGHTWSPATCLAPKTCSACKATEGEKLDHNFVDGKCKCGEIEKVEKFATKFTGDFLYRVGNANSVALGSLFEAKENVTNVEATIETLNETAAKSTYTANDSDWTKGTIKFSDTGIVKVTITADNSVPCELLLEVVDATNATGAASATANNVVLLNDCTFSSLTVSGGYTLYGNGFTMTRDSDSAALNTSNGFVTLDNGTLDNVQIICPNFDYQVLYESNKEDSSNRKQDTDKLRYYNVNSAVLVKGNSKILNSRISGGRAAVYQTGDCDLLVIDNSRIELGAVANILVGSAENLKLKDVTLIQKPTPSTYDSNKILMGFSVLVLCNPDGSSTPITLEGDFVQYAWVNETYKSYVPDGASSVVNTVLNQTAYKHDLDGDKTAESVNLGIAYFLNDAETMNIPDINDNRSNKESVPYEKVVIKVMGKDTYVYSYKNTNGTDSKFTTEPEKYEPNSYSSILPKVSYNKTLAGIEYTTTNASNTLVVDLDTIKSSYDFKFADLVVQKYGKDLEYTVKDANGNDVDKNNTINLSGLFNTEYTLIVEEELFDNKGNNTDKTTTYSIPFTLKATKTSIDPPKFTNAGTATAIRLVSSKGGDWRPAYTVLTGITVEYWSTSESTVKTVDLSTLYNSGTTSSNVWTYTCDDYTLTITGGQVHSDGTKITPVVANNTLYFASTNKAFTTGTTSRDIILTYVFTDKNASTTWNRTEKVSYSALSEYDYDNFKNNGTLKEPSSGGGGCFTPETLITLADGSQVQVQHLKGDEMLLVWDFYNGRYATVPSTIIFNMGTEEYRVLNLKFSDGTVVRTINGHRFFDVNENKFVVIRESNVSSYIGDGFVKLDGSNPQTVKLVDYSVDVEYTTSYSIMSAFHYNAIVEGMLTDTFHEEDAPLFEYFTIGDNLKFDENMMNADVEKYGLYTYEEFADYLTFEEFVALNIQYMKISVGKGKATFEKIIELIDTYMG